MKAVTRKKIKRLIEAELEQVLQEADTEEMSAVDLDQTVNLSPAEFARELKRQQEIENYSEADLLNMWRQWSAAKRKQSGEDIPELPSSAVSAVDAPAAGIEGTQSMYPDDESDEELDSLRRDPDAGERPGGDEKPLGDKTTAARSTVGSPGAGASRDGGSKYQESERLFRYFFGDYDAESLQAMMSGPENETLKEIILQLYGWQLPRYRRTHDGPGTDVIKIAQEFEKEGKNIDGHEDEFMDRLHDYQFTSGKAEFDKVRMTPAQEAERWSIQKLVDQKNMPHPDTVRANLVPKYIEYVKSKYPREYQELYDVALYNFEKWREEKS